MLWLIISLILLTTFFIYYSISHFHNQLHRLLCRLEIKLSDHDFEKSNRHREIQNKIYALEELLIEQRKSLSRLDSQIDKIERKIL